MTVDWPLATLLLIAFVLISFARWRWFKARMERSRRADEARARGDAG